ncbi:thiamine pyrophosphate-requiring enzyme [Aspergillus candidus]|uniref:Pyruvate decarboxylase n=1 Tax=Aspergillus candidus TaxID=41067 RepID=A0A2I2FJ53_ASPCN|nr:thiamine pyrophosphate-requiring enzyme [Aspergillus candidus]PLB40667.1 thiamine pyrophosphate-requiring enzyme [Aspergillus candidus]
MSKMQQKGKVGDLLAHRFEELGVKDYFVVPGDYNLDLLDQLLRNPRLRMVNCCNELNAGYAADGYARTSDTKIAVVVVTYMVGSMSVLNAIAGAYSEGLKVIVLCGGPDSRSYSHRGRVHHSLGIADKEQSLRMFRNVTCASIRLDNDSCAQDIDNVLQKCRSASLPVYIEIPVDIVHKDLVQTSCIAPLPCAEVAPTLDQNVKAIDLFRDTWMAAQCPVILVGSGLRSVLSVEAIDRLVSALGCAAFYLLDGKSRISETHPQCGKLFWSIVSDSGVEETVRAADLWVTLGCRWNDLHTLKAIDLEKERSRMLAIDGSSIQLPDGREITDICTKTFVESLIVSDIPARYASDITLHSNICEHHRREGTAQQHNVPFGDEVCLDDIVEALTGFVSPTDTIIADAGESWFAASRVRLPPQADFQVQLLYSSTGWSLPAAMGCQLARPGGRAIVVIGDGSFQMTGQELSTMIRYRLNAIVVIVNNSGYQIEDAIHHGPYNRIGGWDYTAFAEAVWKGSCSKSDSEPYAMFATKITSQRELHEAFSRACEQPQALALLECCVDPAKASAVVQRFGATLVRN